MNARSFGWGILVCGCLAWSAEADSAKIIKVLSHCVDLQGRIALSPSLYERDAYQALLRQDPKACSGLRYDVQWRGTGVNRAQARVRVEIRTGKQNPARPCVAEAPVKIKGRDRSWASVWFSGEDLPAAGDIVAWRATLWKGDTLLAEQKSFLW